MNNNSQTTVRTPPTDSEISLLVQQSFDTPLSADEAESKARKGKQRKIDLATLMLSAGKCYDQTINALLYAERHCMRMLNDPHPNTGPGTVLWRIEQAQSLSLCATRFARAAVFYGVAASRCRDAGDTDGPGRAAAPHAMKAVHTIKTALDRILRMVTPEVRAFLLEEMPSLQLPTEEV